MKSLIIPMAGKSSRYPDIIPKWLLNDPKTNNFMVLEAISGLNTNFFDQIHFIFLQEHQKKYNFLKGFKKEIAKLGLTKKSYFTFLKNNTSSQPETIYKAVLKNNIKGFIFIKDSDGYYEYKITSINNQISYYDLNETDLINIKSKSYIEIDINNFVSNIIEKKVISSFFSVGGYGFKDAQKFSDTFKKLKKIKGEMYVSHIIFDMMLDGSKFEASKAKNYKDWGTFDDWKNYKTQHKSIFVEIDGILITETNKNFSPYIGQGKSISKNIEIIRKLYNEGKTYIVLTSTRDKSLIATTIRELKRHKIPYHDIILGLPKSQKFIINSFSITDPYPACTAINIERNNENLKHFI